MSSSFESESVSAIADTCLPLQLQEEKLSSSLSSSSPSSERDDDDEQIKYKEKQQQHIAQLKSILLKKYPLSMTWNLVALKDLKQKETLVVYQPENILLADN